MPSHTQKIDGATLLDDYSGLLLEQPKEYSLKEIFEAEQKNIHQVVMKYLSSAPSKKKAPFNVSWMKILHQEMLGEVWDWAGIFRSCELSIGIPANQVPMQIGLLVTQLEKWIEEKEYSQTEIAARLHHRAVQIHPFNNGNGRWSRMLTDIYLKQNMLSPIVWNNNSLAKENDPVRNAYLQALRKADQGDFIDFIALHEQQHSIF